MNLNQQSYNKDNKFKKKFDKTTFENILEKEVLNRDRTDTIYR